MQLGLDGKVIFVAGASRGIGLGIVEACLAEGARVAITARGAEGLEEQRARLAATYGDDKLFALSGDMRDTQVIDDAVARTEAEFGPIFGAVANVGLYPCPPGFEVDDETWDAGFTQNLDSAWRLSRAVLRRMTPRKEGSAAFPATRVAPAPSGATSIQRKRANSRSQRRSMAGRPAGRLRGSYLTTAAASSSRASRRSPHAIPTARKTSMSGSQRRAGSSARLSLAAKSLWPRARAASA